MSGIPFFDELVRLGRAVQARHPRRLLVIAAAIVAGIALVLWPWTIERGPAWERGDRMTGVVMMVLFACTAWWAWAGRPVTRPGRGLGASRANHARVSLST